LRSRHPRRFLLIAILWLLAGGGSLRSASLQPKVQTLPNGLTVVLLEDHATELVASAVWVHVGGKDETDKLAGFSHFLEHLIPMGTRKQPARRQQLAIFRAGGVSRIQADYDRTFFFTEVEASQQDMALEALYQQVAQATLPEAGVDYIRPQLTRELKEAYDEPQRVLFFEQIRAAFPGQPYRFPYFGNFSTLATLEHTSADSFYGNYYVPNNMVVAVGGDIRPPAVLSRIKTLFGAMKASKALPPKPAFEAGFTGQRQVIKDLPRMRPSVSVLFPTPGYRHPDRFALAVLTRLLDEGSGSSLVNAVMDPEKTVLSVSSQFHLLEERGLLAFTAYPTLSAKATDTGERMLVALRKFRSEGFQEADVSRMSREMRLEEAVRRDAVGAMIQDLAEGALFGDLRYGWDREADLARVSAADVNRVAATYLSGRNAKTLIILPKGEKRPTQEEQDRITQAAAGLDAGGAALPAPDFQATQYPGDKVSPPAPHPESLKPSAASRFSLPNGLAVVVKPCRGRGIVAASLAVLAGSAFDSAGKDGLAQMVASSLTLGTKSISGSEFRRRAAAIGSNFGITTFRESVEAGLTAFPEDLPEALALLSGPVIQPLFPEDQMGAVRERILRFGETQASSPEEAARALVREKIYRGHPYGRMSTGTEATLASINREDLAEFHRRFYRPDRAVLVLAGDVTEEQARRLSVAAFGSWAAPAGEKAPEEIPGGATREAMSGEFSRVVEALPATVVVGFPGVPLRDPEFPLVRALGGLLSARGTLDLVLNQPLAYSVTAVPEGLSQGGILYVEATAPSSETARVAYEILLQARTLGVKEVTPSTVSDLVAIERGRLLREKEGLYTLASNLGFYELLGGGSGAYDRGEILPRDLSPKMLKEGAARFLDAAKLVRVTAGPAAR
jgi:zinc protease